MSQAALSSSVDRVTVFRSGAVVRRRARLPLEHGWPEVLALGPLPLAIDDGSVRVSIVAPQSIAPTPADVRVHVVPPPLGEPLIAPEQAEIREARRALERLVERRARIDKELAQLGTLRFSLAEPRPRRVPKPAPLDAWRELDAWARAERRALTEERTALAAKIVLAEENVQALVQRERLARARRDASADPMTKEVRLRLRGGGEAPAEALIELEYIVPGATWVPTYVLRLARDGQSAVLHVRALIAQDTGEPWERVALSLSTAELRREADLPELTSLRIGRRQAAPASTGWRPPPEGASALFAGLDEALAALPPRHELARRPAELDALVEAARSLERSEPEPVKRHAKPRSEKTAAPPPPPEPAPIGAPAPAFAPPPPALAATLSAAGPPRGGMMPSAPPQAFQSADKMERRMAIPIMDAAMDELAERAPDDAPGQELALTPAPPGRPARDALRYGALVMRRWDDAERGRLLPEPSRGEAGDEVARAVRRAASVGVVPLPAGTWAVAEVGGYDHRFDAEAPIDVPSDGRFHGVALFARQTPISSTLVVVPRESDQATRIARLENPLEVPLLPGPADVYWGDELLVTAPVRSVPPGGELRIGLGVEERLKVARNVHFDEETKGLLSATAHLRHEVVIEIASRLPEPVTVEVRERLPVKDEGEKEDLEVALGRVDPPWEEYDQSEVTGAPLRGGRRWRCALDPGQERKLAYAYTVRIGGKHELVGGNRRE